MKQYPEISHVIQYGLPCYCFDKLDGSNIRAEWSLKSSFYKFGTRHHLLGPDYPILGKSISVIKQKYEEPLHEIFHKQRYTNVVCFFEFFGPNSFAGNHLDSDSHDVILLDVNVHKKGMLSPKEFMDLFAHRVEVPKLLHLGPVNKDFERLVRNGELNGMTFEGVVCKSVIKSRHNAATMFKIKNAAWIDKLRSFCKENDNLFNSLL